MSLAFSNASSPYQASQSKAKPNTHKTGKMQLITVIYPRLALHLLFSWFLGSLVRTYDRRGLPICPQTEFVVESGTAASLNNPGSGGFCFFY